MKCARLLVVVAGLGFVGLVAPGCSDDPAPGALEEAAPSRDTFRARVERATGVPWSVDIGVDGTIYMEPRSAPKPLRSAAAVSEFLRMFADDLGMSRTGVETAKTVTLSDGTTAHRFYETWKGVHVEDGHVDVMLSKDGVVELVLGRWIEGLDALSVTPAISEARARTIALEEATSVAPWVSAASTTEPVEPVLVVYTRGGEPRLVYRAVVDAADEAAGQALRRIYVIDAQTGQLVHVRWAGNEAVPVPASGKGVLAHRNGTNERKTFTATKIADASFEMVSPATADLPEIKMIDGRPFIGAVIKSTSTDVWDEEAGSPGNGAAVDAITNLALVAGYFKKVHGRHSYDGRGASLDVYLHTVGDRWASWMPGPGFYRPWSFRFYDRLYDPTGQIYDPTFLPGSTALDVVAHEFGHAMQAYGEFGEAAPTGTGEPAAIGEAMADVLAATVEHHHRPDDQKNWWFGEAGRTTGRPVRSAMHPSESDRPGIDHYSRLNEFTDLYSASHVVAHSFALMTLGGTNATSRITIAKDRALGWAAAERLVFASALRLKRAMGFRELAQDTIWLARRRLFIPVEPVACSWVATGVLSAATVKSEHGVDCGCVNDAGATVPEQDPSLACCADGKVECCRKCDDSILGHWQGDWGKISFRRVGTEIRGVYTYHSGTTVIVPGAESNRYTGWWSELPNRDRYPGIGPEEFGVKGTKIDGRWRHERDARWSENWDLTFVSFEIPQEHQRRLTRDGDFATCRR